ncbi:uncharacterized protein LOC129285118 [Prosopis cineraria]|uniref:uncharacterized protein LOC129285118 n=1 Tax=Prosopis cineraria TaxID=364024 RepID=UPI00240F6F7A|nr:uncharacterized protein LOC129285118 [Prosopis cineraria]
MSDNNININLNSPEDDGGGDFLDLSLSLRQPSPPRRPSPPLSPPQATPQAPVYSRLYIPSYYPSPQIQLPYNNPVYFGSPEVFVGRSPTPQGMHLSISEPPSCRGRARRNHSRNNGEDVNRTIQPPYPWATNRPAVLHDLDYLQSMQIKTITGMVRCTRCDKDYEMGFDLEETLSEFLSFVVSKESMHDRAVEKWTAPPLLTCRYCSVDSVRPIISENKENINWLFLFLGQWMGYCTLEQLKYFCGRTNNHRTGAKDRVLYLAYHEIYEQLLPDWPEDLW